LLLFYGHARSVARIPRLPNTPGNSLAIFSTDNKYAFVIPCVKIAASDLLRYFQIDENP
jgi:hypothetical protein